MSITTPPCKWRRGVSRQDGLTWSRTLSKCSLQWSLSGGGGMFYLQLGSYACSCTYPAAELQPMESHIQTSVSTNSTYGCSFGNWNCWKFFKNNLASKGMLKTCVHVLFFGGILPIVLLTPPHFKRQSPGFPFCRTVS